MRILLKMIAKVIITLSLFVSITLCHIQHVAFRPCDHRNGLPVPEFRTFHVVGCENPLLEKCVFNQGYWTNSWVTFQAPNHTERLYRSIRVKVWPFSSFMSPPLGVKIDSDACKDSGDNNQCPLSPDQLGSTKLEMAVPSEIFGIRLPQKVNLDIELTVTDSFGNIVGCNVVASSCEKPQITIEDNRV